MSAATLDAICLVVLAERTALEQNDERTCV